AFAPARVSRAPAIKDGPEHLVYLLAPPGRRIQPTWILGRLFLEESKPLRVVFVKLPGAIQKRLSRAGQWLPLPAERSLRPAASHRRIAAGRHSVPHRACSWSRIRQAGESRQADQFPRAALTQRSLIPPDQVDRRRLAREQSGALFSVESRAPDRSASCYVLTVSVLTIFLVQEYCQDAHREHIARS